jgi:TolB-like protein
VAKLRHTLEQAGAGDALIETQGSNGYRFVGEVRRPPAGPAGASANGRVKLAVLPLAPLDGGEQEEHLAAGITGELIARLGSHAPDQLGVIARTSVLRYAGTVRSVAQIGRDLRVGMILEGAVQLLAGRAHVSLQLIDVRDQTQRWSTMYDHEAADPLRVQISVAEKSVPCIAELLLEKFRNRAERVTIQAACSPLSRSV